MHQIPHLHHRQVGRQVAGLLVGTEPDQLGSQLVQVPTDVADHRDPPAHDSSGEVQASIGTYCAMLSIRR